MSELKVGDVVELKSGGPPMTVRGFAGGCEVDWYAPSHGNFFRQTFGREQLRLAMGIKSKKPAGDADESEVLKDLKAIQEQIRQAK